MLPETHYAQGGEVNIAYQVVGDGPIDLVFVPGFVSHLDLQWADPRVARFLEKLEQVLQAGVARPVARRAVRFKRRFASGSLPVGRSSAWPDGGRPQG